MGHTIASIFVFVIYFGTLLFLFLCFPCPPPCLNHFYFLFLIVLCIRSALHSKVFIRGCFSIIYFDNSLFTNICCIAFVYYFNRFDIFFGYRIYLIFFTSHFYLSYRQLQSTKFSLTVFCLSMAFSKCNYIVHERVSGLETCLISPQGSYWPIFYSF